MERKGRGEKQEEDDGGRGREEERRRSVAAIGAAEAGTRCKSQVRRFQIGLCSYILTYGHEPRVMTERTRSRIRAAEMAFLRRISGLTTLDMVRSSEIRETLRVEPQRLQIERFVAPILRTRDADIC
ncbi:Uncharacterised protein r2_g2522 [Pycnogonum litorale]